MKYNITKDKLYELFITKNMRRNEVARHFGCSDANIKKQLQKFGIKKPFDLECKNKERKVLMNCLHCGNEYETQKFRTESEIYDSKYCSSSCSQKSRYLGEDHKRRIRNEIASRRRARLLNQTPKLTKEEKQKLQEFYLVCPKGYEVDHIQPIAKGGLHHPDNLQILTMKENRKKWMK
jgi:5-methylcytosine-specific restriction endonuclease McrA